MKYGPGVNKDLPMFHVVSGLFFQRQSNGDMRVMTTNGEWPLETGANLHTDHTIPQQSWCSTVAFSSARGDCQEAIVEVEATLRMEPLLRDVPSDDLLKPFKKLA